MKYLAYAKINLRLEVENKLPNGYHTLHMVNARVSLADELEIEESDKNKVEFSDANLNKMQNNVCLNALEDIIKLYNINKKFNIYITKKIPLGAGLGGGSADVAAIINFLNHYCDLKLSDNEKIKLAVKYGADVPYCLFNELSYVNGIGDEIKFFNKTLKERVILIYPNLFSSTKESFENVKKFTSPTEYEMLKKWIVNKDYDSLLYNDLEDATFKILPTLKQLKKALKQYGNVIMSGSGSTFIVIPKNEESANQIKEKYKEYQLFDTHIL